MKLVRFKSLAILAVAATLPSAAHAAVVISDAFETGSAGDYTVVEGGGPDGTVNFAFDYIAAGIPLAPRSSVGDTSGLRFTANDSFAAANTQTVFHNSIITAPAYRLTVDVFMGFSGTAGTTEFANVGVGGNGSHSRTVSLLRLQDRDHLSHSQVTADRDLITDGFWRRMTAGPTSVPNDGPELLGQRKQQYRYFLFRNTLPCE